MLAKTERNQNIHTLLVRIKMGKPLWKSLAVSLKRKHTYHMIQQFQVKNLLKRKKNYFVQRLASEWSQ